MKIVKLLLIRISDQQAKANVNNMLIREKAKRFFDDLKADEYCQIEFSASNMWFETFKMRTGIHLAVRHGESQC